MGSDRTSGLLLETFDSGGMSQSPLAIERDLRWSCPVLHLRVRAVMVV